ncbi:MAG TPA: DUF4124 domain-containing protein [Myxococcota bacterium]|nr:DUF4124 domain-containing protein [Myxococcota bacterium]
MDRTGGIAVTSALLVALAAAPAAGELHVWVDGEGRTHVSDDPAAVPRSARGGARSADEIRALWDDGLAGPPVETPPGASGRDEDRQARLLRDALDDLARGETARASASLAEVLRREPTRPEAHWYLALLDWQRGRLDASETHLRAFLQSAGDRFDPWRESATRRLARLADERRLLSPPGGALRLVAHTTDAFRLQVDQALQLNGGADFARRVLGYLDEARRGGLDHLGLAPSEPTGVVLYGRASYVKAHGRRFSFQTVGFFDGRIHVASAAHPAGELRSLLVHEYTHALFREATGGDRPFWLNEGLAELAERRSRGMPTITRGERAQLRTWAASGAWPPLRRLSPSFAGLSDDEARSAYLESTAAAAWIDARTNRDQRARLLRMLGEGTPADEALRRVVGVDTDGLDAALRRELASEAP